MHFLYKTTNRITRKFYIGVHSTNDLHDGYYGSGRKLQNSLKRFGVSNHIFELLEMFETRKEALRRENEVVDAEMLKNPMCMNLIEGGGYASYYRWRRAKMQEQREAKRSRGRGFAGGCCAQARAQGSRKKR